MLKRLILLILSFASVQLLQAALTNEDVIRLMDEKPVENYDLAPTEHGLPPSSSGFIILNYDKEVVDGIFSILENEQQQEHWKQAYRSLRRIATAAPEFVAYERLIEQIQKVEKTDTIDDEMKIDLLMLGYPAVARHRNDQAFEFIKTRTDFEFWEGKEINKTVYNSHGAGSGGILQTGQSMAINALSELQTEEAYALLQFLFSEERYISKPHLNILLSGILEYGGWEASAGRLKTIQAEYAKRLELREETAFSQAIAEPSVAPSDHLPALNIKEPAQESTAPEPTIEEPAEVVVAEPIEEEPIEQSSNWWLWFIGTVVVVGGIILFIRSRNQRLK